jgi:hypothetical protein
MATISCKKIESDGWQRAWKGREREITNEGTCTMEEFPNANACVRIRKRREGWVDGLMNGDGAESIGSFFFFP